RVSSQSHRVHLSSFISARTDIFISLPAPPGGAESDDGHPIQAPINIDRAPPRRRIRSPTAARSGAGPECAPTAAGAPSSRLVATDCENPAARSAIRRTRLVSPRRIFRHKRSTGHHSCGFTSSADRVLVLGDWRHCSFDLDAETAGIPWLIRAINET